MGKNHASQYANFGSLLIIFVVYPFVWMNLACNHSIFRHDNFIGCFSADKIKCPQENSLVLTFRFIKTWQKGLLVAVLTMKNTFKQVLQVILRIYVIKLAAFYQRKDECRVSCCILTAYVHTVLEQQLYRFHPLLTEVVRYFRRTVLEDIFRDFHWFIV